MRDLLLRILQLICRGLGLKREYFGHDQFTKDQLLAVNHYPQCPDPSVTLGLPKHCDPNLITIIQQGDVYGLQVFNDGQWLGVKPLPNAFVVNIAYQLQVYLNPLVFQSISIVFLSSSKFHTQSGSFIQES